MREGPEHRNGWRDRFRYRDLDVVIEARHNTSRRMPHGHELARQAMRGHGYAMVEEVRHEWAVLCRGRMVCAIRQNPNGTFSAANIQHAVRRTIREAAEVAVQRAYGLPPEEPTATGEATPTPPGSLP